MFTILAAVAALALSAWLTRRFCNPESRLYILDQPNERSLHTQPTPRTGGVAIFAGVLTGFMLLWLYGNAAQNLVWLGLSTVLMAVLSFVDDSRGVSVGSRLLGHMISAGILLAGGLVMPFFSLPGVVWEWPVWLGTIFSLLFLVWMTNLYNFMDGMDGFAGGMAVIGFGTYAWLGLLAGDQSFAATALMIATAAGGFLAFNFPPARIFMGDTGSSVLGLLAGGMTLWAASTGIFPFWAGLLVFSPFLVDATFTLIRRILRHEQVWRAHKTHYYQRLVQSGWGHRKTVLAEYALMSACSMSAIIAGYLNSAGQAGLLVVWCLIYAGLMFAIDRHQIEKK